MLRLLPVILFSNIHCNPGVQKLDSPGFKTRYGQEIFSSPKYPDWSGAHPASYSLGTRGLPWRKSGQGTITLTHCWG